MQRFSVRSLYAWEDDPVLSLRYGEVYPLPIKQGGCSPRQRQVPKQINS